MILLNSTIKGKQEVKTASKWKGGETPPKFSFFFFKSFFFFLNSSSKWEKLSLVLPDSQCPVEGGLTATTLRPLIINRLFCLCLTGPPCRLPLPESIDSLVHKVKARGANTTPDGTRAILPTPSLQSRLAGSLFLFFSWTCTSSPPGCLSSSS